MIEFGSVVDAVIAATDILEKSSVALRMGLNVCDVVVEGTDILGDGVNLTQRLQDYATPGHICLPAHVMASLAGKLALAPIDRGQVQFKNVERMMHVVEIDPQVKAVVTGAEASYRAEPAGLVSEYDPIDFDDGYDPLKDA